MAKTRAELRADVRARLFDPTGATWPDAVINDALNAALVDLAAVQRDAAVDNVEVANGTGSLPVDFLYPIRFVWEPTNTPLVPWPYPDAPDYTSQGTPTHYILQTGRFEVWPQATGKVRISYWRGARLLTTDQSTVVAPEPEFVEQMLVHYAIATCKHGVGDPDWQQYDALYLREKAAYVDRRLRATQVAYGVLDLPIPPGDSPWRWL